MKSMEVTNFSHKYIEFPNKCSVTYSLKNSNSFQIIRLFNCHGFFMTYISMLVNETNLVTMKHESWSIKQVPTLLLQKVCGLCNSHPRSAMANSSMCMWVNTAGLQWVRLHAIYVNAIHMFLLKGRVTLCSKYL